MLRLPPISNSRARIFWTVGAFLVITIGTLIAIRFAQGYRPDRTGIVSGNGLLVANSTPKGARVLINDRFTTATDDTVYLDPGTYSVTIQKDGYYPWTKQLNVEQELVAQANALLFPLAPSLSPLTFSGALDPVPSPDGQRLLIHAASSSAETKNGYYVVELTDSPLAFQRTPRQISQESSLFPTGVTQALWSPNSSQLLLVSPQKAVLVDPSRYNDVNNLTDVTFQLPTILAEWEEEMYLRDRERLTRFPLVIQELATTSAVNVYFSPDEEKVLYTATESFALPDAILPPKPASSAQAQERATEIGGIYVYDREEDRQFRVGTDEQFLAAVASSSAGLDTLRAIDATAEARSTALLRSFAGIEPESEDAPVRTFNPQKRLLATDLSQSAVKLQASPSAFTRLQQPNIVDTIMAFRTYHSPLFSHNYQWFPNSVHLIHHTAAGITIREYDNTNQVTVYSGPFDQNFVYPWPNGSRLLILTNFQQNQVPPNLYTIDLK